MAFKLDFEKLRDPAWQEKVRKEREEESARLEAHEKALRDLVHRCDQYWETLQAKDRSLVNSVRHKLNTFGIVSEAQEKWLRDIAGRLPE